MTRAGIWDVAYDADGEYEFATATGAFAYGAEWAVGWMIAIVGMGEALRARCAVRIRETPCLEESPLPGDYESCGDCGYDHSYEQEEAVRAHGGGT